MADENLGTIRYSIDADVSGLVQGEEHVDQFRRSAHEAGDQVQRTGRTTEQTGRRVSQSSDRMRKSFGNVTPTVRRLGQAAATAAAGLATIGTARQIRSTIRQTAEISELADVAGVSAERIQELSKSFSDMAGITESTTTGALRRFNRRLGLAEQGTGAAGDTFDQLGVAIQDVNGQMRATEPVLNEAIGRLTEIENESRRAARASELFGEDAGPQIAAALAQGTEALREQIRELQEQGRILSNETAAGAREANDELNRMSDTLSTEFARRVADNAESIEAVASGLMTIVEVGLDAAGAVQTFGEALGFMAGRIVNGEILDTIPKMRDRLNELKDERASLREEFEGKQDLPIFQSQMEELNTEIDSLSSRLEMAQSRVDRMNGPVNVASLNIRTLKEEMQALDGAMPDFSAPDLDVMTIAEEIRSLGQVADARIFDLAEQGVQDMRDQVEPGRAELREFRQQVELLNTAVERNLISTEEAADLQRRLSDGLSEQASGVRTVRGEIESMDEAVQQAGETSGDDFAEGFEGQADRIGDSLADSLMKGDWGGVGDSIGSVIGSTINESLSGMVGESLTDYFKDSGSDFLKDSASSLGSIGGSVFGSVAGGIAGEMASRYVSDFVGPALPDRGELAEQRQEQQFTNTILGDIETQTRSITESTDQMASALDDLVGANRAMLRSLQSSQRSQSRFTSSALRGLGGTNFGSVDIGALGEVGDAFSSLTSDVIQGLDIVTLGLSNLFGSGTLDDMLGDAFGSVFGGGTSLQDRGIEIIGGQIKDLVRGTVVNAYETVEVDGGWFSSDSTERAERRIGGQIEQQFGNAIGGITDSLVSTAEVLGMDASQAASQLEGMQIQTRDISLLDMDAQERQEAIQSYFSSVFDTLSENLFSWTERFQEAGEGLGETVTRLATQNEVLRESHEQLGFTLNEGAMSAQAFTGTADDFVAALGGVENAAAQISSFQSSFMTEAQQLESVEGQMERALGQINQTLPETRGGFLDLLQAQDASTESGQRNIATLLRVQDQADQYYSLLESRQTDAISAVEDAMQTLEGEIGQVESALDSMSQTATQREMSRLDAVDALQNALATGDFSGVGEAAQTAANLDASQFSTREQFLRAQGVTGNLLQQVQAEGERQLSNAEQQVTLLEDANGISESQLSTLKRIERSLVGGTTVDGSHARGLGSVPFDGYRAELHKGEMVVPADQAQGLRNGGGSVNMDEVVDAIRDLRNDLDRIANYGFETAKSTRRSRRLMEQWDRIGVPTEEVSS